MNDAQRIPFRSRIQVLLICLLLAAWTPALLTNSKPDTNAPHAERMRPSEVHFYPPVGLEATPGDAAAVNLNIGVSLPSAYSGSDMLVHALTNGLAEPFTLATGDFNDDGMDDLITGYLAPTGAFVSLRQGDLRAFFLRHVDDVSASPLQAEAQLFELPVRPELLAVGDFDADGHLDLIAAATHHPAMYLLPGDGQGSFGIPRKTTLPGGATALAAGDLNRPDGIDDLVVGITREDIAGQVLVYEGPFGSWQSTPEAFPFDHTPEALVMAQLDDDLWVDLAVAAGKDLRVIYGRDRRLSLDVTLREAVPEAQLKGHRFASRITSLATGNYVGDWQKEVALLSPKGDLTLFDPRSGAVRQASFEVAAGHLQTTRTSVSVRDDLLLMDAGRSRLRLLHEGHFEQMERPEQQGLEQQSLPVPRLEPVEIEVGSAAVAVAPMRLNKDARSDLMVLQRPSLSPFATDTAAPFSEASHFLYLTRASNSFIINRDTDESDPNLGDHRCDIDLATPATDECTLRAAIEQANASGGDTSISFDSGITLIAVPYALPAFENPVTLDGLLGGEGRMTLHAHVKMKGSGNAIQNLILGGITIEDGGNNKIERCYFGTDASGTVAFGGGGVTLRNSSDNTIGGGSFSANCEACNINLSLTIAGEGSRNNTVKGNAIGVDKTGEKRFDGQVVLASAVKDTRIQDNVIGGAQTALYAVTLGFGSSGNLVQSNMIGTNSAGDAVLDGEEVWAGISVVNESVGNTVGGTVASLRNVVAGFPGTGISVNGREHYIQGNYVGVNAEGSCEKVDGKCPFGNGEGMVVMSDQSYIGGASGGGNVVAGNEGWGIRLATGNEGNYTQGNIIGLDATGTTPLGNKYGGINIDARNEIVGGRAESGKSGVASVAPGNIIAANGGPGIEIGSYQNIDNAHTTIFQRNWIGVDASGLAQPNYGDGILIHDGTHESGMTLLIGGDNASDGNIIAYNKGSGIRFEGSESFGLKIGGPATIRFNQIYENEKLGIDLGNEDVRENDEGDDDEGPNRLQNYPDLYILGDNLPLGVEFKSAPDATYTIDFYTNDACDASGYGEGKKHVDTKTVSTGSTGAAELFFSNIIPSDNFVYTATATDAAGHTSEFSACAFDCRVGKRGAVPEGCSTYVMEPQGIAYDVNYLDDLGFQDFPNFSLKGTGLEDVIKIFFQDSRGEKFEWLEAEIKEQTDTEIIYEASIDYLFLGTTEVDLILKTVDPNNEFINVSEVTGQKFIISRIKTEFNQAVSNLALTGPRQNAHIANRKGVIRIQFDDEAQYGHTFTAALAVIDADNEELVGVEESLITHAVKATYGPDERMEGGDYLVIPIPEPEGPFLDGLLPGSYTFSFVLERDDGIVLDGPPITRRAVASKPLNLFNIRLVPEFASDDEVASLAETQAATSFIPEVYPVSSPVATYADLGLQRMPPIETTTTAGVNHLTKEGIEKLLRILGGLRDIMTRVLGRRGVVVAYLPEGVLNDYTEAAPKQIPAYTSPEKCTILISGKQNLSTTLVHTIGHLLRPCLSSRFSLGDEYEHSQVHLYQCYVNPPAAEVYRCSGTQPAGALQGTFVQSGFDAGTLKQKTWWKWNNDTHHLINFAGREEAALTWVSDLVYDQLMKTFVPVGARKQDNTSELLEMIGVIYKDGTARFDNFTLLTDSIATAPSTGPYSLELQDSGGGVLASHSFDVSFTAWSEPPVETDYAFFNIRLEPPGGTKGVVLRKDGTELVRRTLSDNAPKVTITAPQPGTSVQGSFDLTWTAEDDDGDALTYAIFYEPEPDSLIPVDALLTETSYRVDASLWDASSGSMLRVMASDGLNTGEASVTLQVVPVAVEEETTKVPQQALLGANYPNPFRETTMIPYEVPVQSRVVLKVYDVLGQEVETLVDRVQGPGRYEATWEVGHLPAGVYFYRLETGTYRAVQKMTRLR